MFRKIIQDAIDSGDVESFHLFSNEPKAKKRKRKKFYENEKKEAEEELKRQKIGKSTRFQFEVIGKNYITLFVTGKFESESDLERLILSRQSNRRKEMDSFLSNLEAKYAKPAKSKTSSSKSRKKKP